MQTILPCTIDSADLGRSDSVSQNDVRSFEQLIIILESQCPQLFQRDFPFVNGFADNGAVAANALELFQLFK